MARRPQWTKLPLAAMLAEYGLSLYSWEEASSCLKVETDHGLFRLKCFAYPASEFPFVFRLVQYLAQKGLPHPEMIQLTTQDRLGLTRGGRFYYLATWQEGITDFELDKETLEQVGDLLGRLHYSSQGFTAAEAVHPARIQWGAWPGKLTARYSDLVRFAGLAREGAAAFDRVYTKKAPAFLEDAQKALKKLESRTCYQEIVNQDRQAHSVCHRDCIPGNIVKRWKGLMI